MKRILISAGWLTLVLTGCKKDKNDSNSCSALQYGTLSISYGATDTKHSILTTSTPGAFREKISGMGVASDTLHLAPGAYTLSISSIDDQGLAVDQVSKTATITVCSESKIAVTF